MTKHMVVFDPARIGGSSPQSGRFVCEGLKPGSELYYVTFPYTDVSEATGVVVEGLRRVEITGNRRIRVTYSISLFYELDFGLKCLQVDWGHGYMAKHKEMVEAGKLTSVLDDAYRAKLSEAIRYWNGTAWVAKPARNSR